MGSRILYYFPIIHSHTEMGQLGEASLKSILGRLGPDEFRQKSEFIDQFWASLDRILEDQLHLDYATVRIYQDGLPVCDREFEIVRDIAAMGSRNHEIIMRLHTYGATIMGTESPGLLLEEYHFAKSLLRTVDTEDSPPDPEPDCALRGERILAKRDAFIAARIDETLAEGETGILFLGMLHDLRGLLADSIEVRYPMGEPSQFIRGGS